MNNTVKSIIKNIKNMGFNELEALKEKVYSSLLSGAEKDVLVSTIEERLLNMDRNEAMVEFSEVELD